MKYLVGIGLLAVGGVIGFFIGSTFSKSEKIVDESPKTEFITQTVHDTIVQTQEISVPVANLENDSLTTLNDSLAFESDSLSESVVDTNEVDISISREVLEKSIWLDVQVLKEFEDNDSLIKEMMGIEESMPTKILVEFWQSPLNFSGYKLSKSKLLVYGMPSQLTYKLYRKKGDYYLSTENVFYGLKETDEFLSYIEVSKEIIFND